MATLAGNTIASTYPLLLKIDSNGIDGTLRAVQDGDATDSALSIATDSVLVKGSGVRLYFHDADGGEHIAGDGTDLTITSGNDIKLAVGSAGSVHSSGVGGTGNTVLGIDAGIGLESGSNYNVFIGDLTGDSSLNDCLYSVGVGYAALSSLTTGDRNTALGYQTLTACTTGEENIAIGRNSMDACVSGSYNIGIGTNTLGTMADVASTFNIAIGYDAMSTANHADIDECIAIGHSALNSLGTNSGGAGSIAIGYQALEDLTTGDKNIAIGYQSAANITTGFHNVIIGHGALDAADGGENHNIAMGVDALGSANENGVSANIAIGTRAMDSTGAQAIANCVAIGYQALRNAENAADGTIAIGKEALTALTTATECIAIGQNALSSMTTSTGMIAIGDDAGKDCDSTGSTPDGCVYIGASCGQNLDDGTRNTAVGFEAMTGNTENANTPNYSVAVGWKALTSITDGDRNVTIGAESGTNLESGSYNVLVGYGTQASAADSENAVVIGYDISGGGNEVTIGKASNVLTNNFTSGSTWAQSSDERIKTDIKDDNLGLDFIKELKTKTFKWKPSNEVPKELTEHYNEVNQKNTDVVMHGMIAQEVKAALDKSGVDTFGGWSEKSDGSQNISREMFVIPLIKAVQELSTELEELKKKVG